MYECVCVCMSVCVCVYMRVCVCDEGVCVWIYMLLKDHILGFFPVYSDAQC